MCLVFLCQNRAVAAEGRRKGDALLRAALIPAELYAACNEASRTVSSMIRLPRLKRRKRLVFGGRFAGPCGRAARAGARLSRARQSGLVPDFALDASAWDEPRGRSVAAPSQSAQRCESLAAGGGFGADKANGNLSEPTPESRRVGPVRSAASPYAAGAPHTG